MSTYEEEKQEAEKRFKEWDSVKFKEIYTKLELERKRFRQSILVGAAFFVSAVIFTYGFVYQFGRDPSVSSGYDKNNTEIVQIKGKGQTKNRDFPLDPDYFNSLTNVHQRAKYVVRSNDGGLVILTTSMGGRYQYKKDKNLDGIIDAEGIGNYNHITADTVIVTEYSITQKVK
ncbi:MAG: hypothetical protein ACP5NV_03640 [Candidatus Woesearchaeota archaeon]